MTPYAVYLVIEAYQKQKEDEAKVIEYKAWLHGAYIRQAIYSSVGNMFLDKGAKEIEYPENPLLDGKSNNGELSEIEKQRELDKFFAERDRFRTMWNVSHGKTEDS